MADKPDDIDPDQAELARMEAEEAAEARAARKALGQRPEPRYGVAAEDQPFADEPKLDPEYEQLPDARTAASTGARMPLRLAAALCAVIHAIPPLVTIGERLHFGRQLMHLSDRLSPYLWLRLTHTRLSAGWEQWALSFLEVALCIGALTQAGTRLRVAVQLFAGAAILNAADWYLFGFDLLHNPALNEGARRGMIMFSVLELALAGLLWLRVAPPVGMIPTLRGRRS